MEKIEFFDELTGETILFELVDYAVIDGHKYLLVADEEDNATILKEIIDDGDEITYELVEDDNEFQKAALTLMESDEYDIEI
ncbi:DUF1292 domain-containing protein [Niameybacter massiliensis]|uniref:DUF1292 domain-containing protein n=1 Tax=Holtiella tumoricola TaxID=3018743 RepID=A0AA42DNP1_9FIRM|nr:MULTISPECIES: DUF1292 domain-containing protein [Lachnospirales]MDA3732404.1 DUF1292 domain-containing protein [Holtiella tumoricola]